MTDFSPNYLDSEGPRSGPVFFTDSLGAAQRMRLCRVKPLSYKKGWMSWCVKTSVSGNLFEALGGAQTTPET